MGMCQNTSTPKKVRFLVGFPFSNRKGYLNKPKVRPISNADPGSPESLLLTALLRELIRSEPRDTSQEPFIWDKVFSLERYSDASQYLDKQEPTQLRAQATWVQTHPFSEPSRYPLVVSVEFS